MRDTAEERQRCRRPRAATNPQGTCYYSDTLLTTPLRQGIDAVAAGAPGGNEQKDETVYGRQLTLVDDGPESVRRVRHEIGGCHQAAREERGIAGGEPDGDGQAAE